MQNRAAGNAGTKWSPAPCRPSRPHSCETIFDERVKGCAAADRVGDRQAEALSFCGHQRLGGVGVVSRGVETHPAAADRRIGAAAEADRQVDHRSEEHTSELQSLMRISYAVFC